MAPLPLSRRPYDCFFLAYFIVHIPITLCCDSQLLLPREYFHPALVQMMQSWIVDYDDVLSASPPIWFRSFIAFELLAHLPFFFLGAYAFIRGAQWIRTFAIIYSVQVATTMLAIIPELWVGSHAPLNTKLACMSVYGVWLLVPLMLLQRVWAIDVFPEDTLVAKKRK
jgi:hypothetical protein